VGWPGHGGDDAVGERIDVGRAVHCLILPSPMTADQISEVSEIRKN
jgi:hypothetical protein